MLYPVVVTHTQGELQQGVQGIMAWRKALLEGYLPNNKQINWPNQPILGKLLSILGKLDIVRFCKQQVELTDNLLLDVCEAVSQFEKIQGEQFNIHFEKLKQQELEPQKEQIRQKKLRKQSARKRNKKVDTQSIPLILDAETLKKIQKKALYLAGENAADVAGDKFKLDWQERASMWHELAKVFDELGGLLGRGWDLSQGLLASQGWLEMVKLR